MWAGIFPGQGSQHSGMGKFLFENFQSSKQAFEEASDTLKQDFKKLCFEAPESELSLTENTQPALLLVSYCSFLALKETTDINFTAFSGHSVGEYAAVVAGQSLSFAEALTSVRRRGQWMQEVVPVGHGGMAAVMGLTPEQTHQLCEWVAESTNEVLEPANFNAPGQIVISGSSKALTWLKDNFQVSLFETPPKRCKIIPLKVSAPFHCSLMKPAQEKMSLLLNDMQFKEAIIPIVQNVDTKSHTAAGEIKELLIQQISAPVRWVECVEQLKALGCHKFIELGCGKVLAGLLKKIDVELKVYSLNSLDDLKSIS